MTDDKALLAKLNDAVAAENEARKAAETATTELVSRGRVVGQLLLEAKKLHPKVADFEKFLRRVDGLHLSRAYDLMKLAGGRTTDAELREDARERKRKSRERKKTPPAPPPALPSKPAPDTKPPLSVTVTESSPRQSEFYRNQLIGYIRSMGPKITAPEDQEMVWIVLSNLWKRKAAA